MLRGAIWTTRLSSFVLGSRYGSVRIGDPIHRRSERGGDILNDLSRSPSSDGIALDYISIVIVIQRGGNMHIVMRRREGSNVVIVRHIVLPEYIL